MVEPEDERLIRLIDLLTKAYNDRSVVQQVTRGANGAVSTSISFPTSEDEERANRKEAFDNVFGFSAVAMV